VAGLGGRNRDGTHFVGIFLVDVVFELLAAELDEVFRVNLDHVCYGRLEGFVNNLYSQISFRWTH